MQLNASVAVGVGGNHMASVHTNSTGRTCKDGAVGAVVVEIGMQITSVY